MKFESAYNAKNLLALPALKEEGLIRNVLQNRNLTLLLHWLKVYLSTCTRWKGSPWSFLLCCWIPRAKIQLALHFHFNAFWVASWFLRQQIRIIVANDIWKARLFIDAILNLLLLAYMALNVHKVGQNRCNWQHLAFAVTSLASELLAPGIGSRRHVSSAWSLRHLSLAQLNILAAFSIFTHSRIGWEWNLRSTSWALCLCFRVNRLKVWTQIGFISL